MGFPSSIPSHTIDPLEIDPVAPQDPPSSQPLFQPLSSSYTDHSRGIPCAGRHSSSSAGEESDCLPSAAARDMTEMELLIVEVLRTMKGCQASRTCERTKLWLPYRKSDDVEDERVQPRFRYVSDLYGMNKAKKAVSM